MPDAAGVTDAEAALARGAFYGSLAKAFGPVEKPLISGDVFEELRSLGGEWQEVDESLTKLPESLESSLDEARSVAAERVRLFERGECPPYESSHRGDVDPLQDVVMADVAGFYKAFGLEPKGELPDHIVSELEFMALLCLKESHALLQEEDEGLEVVRSAQFKFMRDHLGRWVDSFREAVHSKSQVAIYLILADLLADFIEAEKGRLSIHEEGQGG